MLLSGNPCKFHSTVADFGNNFRVLRISRVARGAANQKEDIQKLLRLTRHVLCEGESLRGVPPRILSMVALQKALEAFLVNSPEQQEAQAVRV